MDEPGQRFNYAARALVVWVPGLMEITSPERAWVKATARVLNGRIWLARPGRIIAIIVIGSKLLLLREHHVKAPISTADLCRRSRVHFAASPCHEVL